MPPRPRDIVVISSHVSRGCVGSRAIAFALERLGFRVWLVPTIILPRHPGHGPVEPILLPDAAFADHLTALAALPAIADVGAVLSGYLATPAQADAVARFVATVRAARPDTVYLCDPIIGDAGGLYVGEAIAAAVRDVLMPVAGIVTPNDFEAAWLAGLEAGEDGREADVRGIASRLATPLTVITSHPALTRGHIANVLIENGAVTLAEHRQVETAVRGTGDLFAAVFLGRLMQGHDARVALQMASATVLNVVAMTARCGSDELELVKAQPAVVAPQAQVFLRSLATARDRAPRPL